MLVGVVVDLGGGVGFLNIRAEEMLDVLTEFAGLGLGALNSLLMEIGGE